MHINFNHNVLHNQKKLYLCEMEASTNKRGGRRTGAGSKLKYGEPTINITFRIPQSKKDQIKAMVKKYLSTMTANTNSNAN